MSCDNGSDALGRRRVELPGGYSILRSVEGTCDLVLPTGETVFVDLGWYQALAFAQAVSTPAAFGLGECIGIARRGFEAWAAKDHNRRWFRKIDGTPIPNDLTVNIAEAFADAISSHAEPTGLAENRARGAEGGEAEG